MRRLLRTLGVGSALLVVGYLAGPRVELDETLVPVELPADLDAYL